MEGFEQVIVGTSVQSVDNCCGRHVDRAGYNAYRGGTTPLFDLVYQPQARILHLN